MQDSPPPDSGTCSSANQTPGADQCSPATGPESPSTTTYALSENQRGELLLTEQSHQLTTGGGKPGQGYPCVATLPSISSSEGSPAKTCPSQATAQASRANDRDSSSNSPGSSTLFDPDGYSSRTYQGCSPRTAVGTSESCLERWPTSGTAWHGGFSTAVSSECRSADGVCSSSQPSLTEILEPPHSVPAKYSLSARAAQGILRRAEKRGRELPTHLKSALRQLVADGGGLDQERCRGGMTRTQECS